MRQGLITGVAQVCKTQQTNLTVNMGFQWNIMILDVKIMRKMAHVGVGVNIHTVLV